MDLIMGDDCMDEPMGMAVLMSLLGWLYGCAYGDCCMDEHMRDGCMDEPKGDG